MTANTTMETTIIRNGVVVWKRRRKRKRKRKGRGGRAGPGLDRNDKPMYTSDGLL
jgi:hypothetical protein